MNEYIIEMAGVVMSFGGIDTFPDGAVRERIVRCRDCKWFDRIASGGVCVRHGYFSIYTTDDGFCSKAKRRDT